jgi:ABC-type transport system involved in multi-copper enzyme maturation permease subunit
MMALLIARYTLLEALRRRLLLAILILSIAYLGLFALGFSLLHQEVVRETSRSNPSGNTELIGFSAFMTVMGFYALSFLSSLMALFASAGAISGEVDSGLLHAVLAKPISRRDIVLGKYFGQASLIIVYVSMMTAGMVLASRIAAGYTPPDPVRAAVFMIWSALILLSLGTLGGTFLPALTNGVAVFLLFGLSRVAAVIEWIGQMAKIDTMVNVGITVSLLMPSDALWQAASYYLLPQAIIAMMTASPTSGMPFASALPPTIAMLAWSAGYVVMAVIAGILVFNRRDL